MTKGITVSEIVKIIKYGSKGGLKTGWIIKLGERNLAQAIFDRLPEQPKITKEDIEKVLPKEKEHMALLSNKDLIFTGELTEHRTVKDWIKYGYNQARKDCLDAVMELLKEE